MRLFESIIDANHRAVAGDASAGIHPAEFADALPVVALTCIDPRLNAFFPNALALPAEQFIWLRNAGNIIFDPMSSMTRTLALACAIKGGREIAIIGHTDCLVCKTTIAGLLEKLKALGVDRSRLPDNLNEFFGMSGSERQNVIKACDFVRHSPLIGPKIPVHGLMIDVESGKLDWVVNGYETLSAQLQTQTQNANFASMVEIGSFKDFNMGEMRFPEMQIGEAAAKVQKEISTRPHMAERQSSSSSVEEIMQKHWPKTAVPPPIARPPTLPPGKKKLAVPPPIRPRPTFQK